MSDPKEHKAVPEPNERIELSETFEKSAEVISYEPSEKFVQPPMMAMDSEPPEQ